MLAGPTPRRPLRWVVAAASVVVSVAGAVVAPSSWWAVTFVGGVVVTMLALRGVVGPRYRAGWSRSVVVVSLAAACAAGVYAFAVEPFGPSRAAYGFALVLVLAVTVAVRDAAQVHGTAEVQAAIYRAYVNGRRR